jgi:hypothetical protein
LSILLLIFGVPPWLYPEIHTTDLASSYPWLALYF